MPITLGYWNIKGFAEVVRFVLALADQEYTEVNHTLQEWGALKAENTILDFPNLPYLILEDGFKFTETYAICQYLARTYMTDLVGADLKEDALINQTIGVLMDLRSIFMPAVFAQRIEIIFYLMKVIL